MCPYKVHVSVHSIREWFVLATNQFCSDSPQTQNTQHSRFLYRPKRIPHIPTSIGSRFVECITLVPQHQMMMCTDEIHFPIPFVVLPLLGPMTRARAPPTVHSCIVYIWCNAFNPAAAANCVFGVPCRALHILLKTVGNNFVQHII